MTQCAMKLLIIPFLVIFLVTYLIHLKSLSLKESLSIKEVLKVCLL